MDPTVAFVVATTVPSITVWICVARLYALDVVPCAVVQA